MSDFTASNGYKVATLDAFYRVVSDEDHNILFESGNVTDAALRALVEFANSIGIRVVGHLGWHRVEAALAFIAQTQSANEDSVSMFRTDEVMTLLGDVALLLNGEELNVYPVPPVNEVGASEAHSDQYDSIPRTDYESLAEQAQPGSLDELFEKSGLGAEGPYTVERVAEVLAAYIHGDDGNMPAAEAYFMAVIEDRCDQTHLPVDGEEFAEFQAWRQERARIHRTEEAIDAVCRAAKPFPTDRSGIKAALRDLVAGVQAGDIDLGDGS